MKVLMRHGKRNFSRNYGKLSRDQCFNCKKFGHWAKDCPERRIHNVGETKKSIEMEC